jgi:hypothetical protein
MHVHLSRFWTDRVEEERAQPRRLWQSFDEILGRGRAHPPTSTLQPSIGISTIKLPVFELLPLVLLHPSSLLYLLVASCESLHLSLLLMSSRW